MRPGRRSRRPPNWLELPRARTRGPRPLGASGERASPALAAKEARAERTARAWELPQQSSWEFQIHDDSSETFSYLTLQHSQVPAFNNFASHKDRHPHHTRSLGKESDRSPCLNTQDHIYFVVKTYSGGRAAGQPSVAARWPAQLLHRTTHAGHSGGYRPWIVVHTSDPIVHRRPCAAASHTRAGRAASAGSALYAPAPAAAGWSATCWRRTKTPRKAVEARTSAAPPTDSGVGTCGGAGAVRKVAAQLLHPRLQHGSHEAGGRRAGDARLVEDEVPVRDGQHDGEVGHRQRGRGLDMAQRVGHADLGAVAGHACARCPDIACAAACAHRTADQPAQETGNLDARKTAPGPHRCRPAWRPSATRA